MKFNVDFNYGYGAREYQLITASIELPNSKKPFSKKIAIDALKEQQSRYKESIFTQFVPVAGICHAYIRGWSCGYLAILFADINDFNEHKNRHFASEPSGKYSMKRLIYKF